MCVVLIFTMVIYTLLIGEEFILKTYQIVQKKITGETIECIGPEVLTFKEILLKILNSINKKRFLIPVPLSFAKLNAKLFDFQQNS